MTGAPCCLQSQDVKTAAMEGAPRPRKPKAPRKPEASSTPVQAPAARQRQPAHLQEDAVIADLGALSALAKQALSAVKPQPTPARRHRRPQSGESPDAPLPLPSRTQLMLSCTLHALSI